MKQYNSIKGKHPDALLLFRVGDFYETFGSDAIKASEILGIVLTKRANGSASSIELAGFPHHSLDTYLPKLVRAGQRVAICEQLEDPKTTKKIVKRGVTELVTPGIAANDKMLDHKSNNFLAVVHFDDKKIGLALLDYSTGEFTAAQGRRSYIDKLLQSFDPSEVVYSKSSKKEFDEFAGDQFYSYALDEWVFNTDYANEVLLRQFETSSLKGFGIEGMDLAVIAAGAALQYLGDTNNEHLEHIRTISRIDEDEHVWLDKFSIRNLELINSPHENAKTLFDILDRTLSPMGARMLKKWIVFPLVDTKRIEERLQLVEHFIKYEDLSDEYRSHIKQCGDLERIISRLAMRRINPRELVQLQKSLEHIAPIKKIGAASKLPALKKIADQLNVCEALTKQVSSCIKEDPPALIAKCGVIADGYSEELDELRAISTSGKDKLLMIRQREIDRTGIPSLKVAFNNVFGYYIEVTNAHKDKVPEDWVRKQTLVNAERYITDELKSYEEKILGAEGKIKEIEERLYNELVISMLDYVAPVQQNAVLLARLDCLLAFADLAIVNSYVKPSVNKTKIIDIKDGRHPVLEKQMVPGESYVPNNVYLDNDQQQIMMITGPNMSGKSALLRQTALIVLMAQMGSFVPAKSADIGFIDKIFTRVGASDNISSGESTFMVEMNETASILNNISDRSLILLDEIGRGTSTYDGISIAWAIAEYLHDHPKARAKTLFATHYHELNEMEGKFERIKNFNVSIRESGKQILFLRKLVPGGSEHSFGIHVAKMAGMPPKVLRRATEMLKILEKAHSSSGISAADLSESEENVQLSFFQLDDPLLEQIREDIINIDIDTLTPVEALMKLHSIKELIRKK